MVLAALSGDGYLIVEAMLFDGVVNSKFRLGVRLPCDHAGDAILSMMPLIVSCSS